MSVAGLVYILSQQNIKTPHTWYNSINTQKVAAAAAARVLYVERMRCQNADTKQFWLKNFKDPWTKSVINNANGKNNFWSILTIFIISYIFQFLNGFVLLFLCYLQIWFSAHFAFCCTFTGIPCRILSRQFSTSQNPCC